MNTAGKKLKRRRRENTALRSPHSELRISVLSVMFIVMGLWIAICLIGVTWLDGAYETFFFSIFTLFISDFHFGFFYECDGQVAFTRMCGITSWSLKESRKEVAGSFLQCEYLLAFVFFFSCYLHNECDPPSWKTIHLHPDASSADAEAKRERRSSMRGRWWGNYIAICHHLSKSSLINGKIMNMYSLHEK